MIRLLLVDDSPTNRAALRAALSDDSGIEIVGEAGNGEEAIERALELAPDVVLMDVRMPVLDGIRATERVRQLAPGIRGVGRPAHEEQGVLGALIAAGARSYCLKGAPLADLRHALESAVTGAHVDGRVMPKVLDEVVRLFQQERVAVWQLAAANSEIADQSDRLERLTHGIVHSLAAAIEARDRYTGGHVERVSRYAMLLTERVAPAVARDPRVEFGYVLHDVGKIGVPDRVLLSTGPLDDEGWALMRAHVEIGGRLLEPIPEFESVREVVLCHHERWDGSGYPAGLRGDEIPITARLFAVCDAFDAMTTDRPYQAARSLEEALEQLAACAGSQFDPEPVAELTALARRGALEPVGTA